MGFARRRRSRARAGAGGCSRRRSRCLDVDGAAERDAVFAGDERCADRLEAAAEDGEPAWSTSKLAFEWTASAVQVPSGRVVRWSWWSSGVPPWLRLQLLTKQYCSNNCCRRQLLYGIIGHERCDTPPSGIDEDQLPAWRAFLRAHSTMLRRIAATSSRRGCRRSPGTTCSPPPRRAERSAAEAGRARGARPFLQQRPQPAARQDRVGGAARARPCPGDRRSLHVELTQAGAEMLERMWPV